MWLGHQENLGICFFGGLEQDGLGRHGGEPHMLCAVVMACGQAPPHRAMVGLLRKEAAAFQGEVGAVVPRRRDW